MKSQFLVVILTLANPMAFAADGFIELGRETGGYGRIGDDNSGRETGGIEGSINQRASQEETAAIARGDLLITKDKRAQSHRFVKIANLSSIGSTWFNDEWWCDARHPELPCDPLDDLNHKNKIRGLYWAIEIQRTAFIQKALTACAEGGILPRVENYVQLVSALGYSATDQNELAMESLLGFDMIKNQTETFATSTSSRLGRLFFQIQPKYFDIVWDFQLPLSTQVFSTRCISQ